MRLANPSGGACPDHLAQIWGYGREPAMPPATGLVDAGEVSAHRQVGDWRAAMEDRAVPGMLAIGLAAAPYPRRRVLSAFDRCCMTARRILEAISPTAASLSSPLASRHARSAARSTSSTSAPERSSAKALVAR